MKVFRLSNEAEITAILENKSFVGLGKEFAINPKLNNHKYQPQQRYMHFFKDFGSIFYLFPDEGKYICTYDLPKDLLDRTMGEGSYLDYFFYRNLQSTTEYAVPEGDMDFAYLQRIDRITKEIDVEDYIADRTLSRNISTIYDSSQKTQSLENKTLGE